MNENIAGYLTCPICDEPKQELRINKNRKLYLFCDNGCSLKLNNAKSKRYLPVLLSGSDVKDEKLGLIISACKGNKINEIIKQKEVRNAGFEEVQNGRTSTIGSSRTGIRTAGNDNAAGSSAGSSRSAVIRRPDGSDSGSRSNSIISRAAAWLAADDDD